QAIERPALLVPGDPDDLCDHVWLPRRRGQSTRLWTLMFGDGDSDGDGEGSAAGHGDREEAGEEQYLCISLSTVAAVAPGRQLTLRSAADPGGLSVERPPGTNIRDPAAKVLERTLARVLDEHGIAYLDWRLTESPPEGHHPGRYLELHGLEQPPLAAYL